MKISIIIIFVFLCMAASDSFAYVDSAELLERLEKVEQTLAKIESSYEAEIAKLQKGNPQAVSVNNTEYEETVASLITQISALENEMQQLRESMDSTKAEQRTKYADLDGMFVELGDKVETAKTEKASPPQNSPEIKRGKIFLGGLLHQHYYNETGSDDESSFLCKRVFLSLKGKINDYAAFMFLGQFAGSPTLLDGALTLSPGKQWSVCVGQYRPPFGTEFLGPTSGMPFVNSSKAKGLGTGRDIGASVTYANQSKTDLSYKVSMGFFNGSGTNTSDVNNDKNFIGRIELGLSDMFTIAPNMILGKTNDTGIAREDHKVYGGSATWKWNRETAVAEYIYSKTGDTEKAGWYIWGGHTFAVNSKLLQEIQLLARYEQYDVDLDLDDNRVDRITIGANIFVDKNYTKLQLNYQINGEETTSVNNDEFILNLQVAF